MSDRLRSIPCLIRGEMQARNWSPTGEAVRVGDYVFWLTGNGMALAWSSRTHRYLTRNAKTLKAA